jgi:transposase
VITAFKYRLYPNQDQRIALAQHFGCVRWIYNWALAKKSAAWKDEKKTISRFDLSAELPKLKRAEGTEWLGEVTAQCLQQSLRCLDEAYQHFFKDKLGFPKFKRKDGYQSCDTVHDRDVLAAQNIRRMAFNLVGRDSPELNACRDSAIAGSLKQEVSNQRQVIKRRDSFRYAYQYHG